MQDLYHQPYHEDFYRSQFMKDFPQVGIRYLALAAMPEFRKAFASSAKADVKRSQHETNFSGVTIIIGA